MAGETPVTPAPTAPTPVATPVEAPVASTPSETVESITKSSPTATPATPSTETKPPATTVTQPAGVQAPIADTRPRDQSGKFTPSDPRGFDLLDASEFAPEIWAKIEPRLKRYHRQVKQADKNFQSLVAHNQALEKKLMEIAAPQEFAGIQQQYNSMEQQAQQAASQGDWITYGRLQRDLAQLEAQAQNFQPKPLDIPTPAHPFDADETATINKWAQAREWAQKTHPMFEFAKDIGSKLFQDPGWKQRDTEEVLQEIDRIMAAVLQRQQPAPQQQQRPQVLSNNQRAPQQQQRKIELNGGQKMVAERMFLRNGMAQNREQAHEMYRKQLEIL